jgi:spermidine/putrescine transport system ATP-binding protein
LTEAGTFVLGEDVGKDKDATFVVAADLMAPSFTKPKKGNVVEAQLISEEFVGSMLTLFLETKGGMELKVQVQERALAEFKRGPGQTLYLSFDPTHAHLLKG